MMVKRIKKCLVSSLQFQGKTKDQETEEARSEATSSKEGHGRLAGGSPVFQGSVGVPPALKMEKIMEPRKNVNGREMRRGIKIYREDWK